MAQVKAELQVGAPEGTRQLRAGGPGGDFGVQTTGAATEATLSVLASGLVNRPFDGLRLIPGPHGPVRVTYVQLPSQAPVVVLDLGYDADGELVSVDRTNP